MNFTFLKKSTTLLFLGVFSITLSSNAQTTDSTETIQLISTSVIQFPTDSTKIDSSENKLTTSNNSNILFNYKEPKKFKVAGIEINGTQYLDKNIIRSLTGIKIGDAVTVPGDDLTKSIKNLWKQGLFGDIKIFADKVEGELIYLSIDVQEKPRLNDISIKGLKKSEADDLKKKFELLKGKPLTDALKVNIKNIIVDKYEEKSYLNPIIDIKDKKDEGLVNSASLIVTVDKGNKVKINNIDFIGREYGELSKMRKAMKGTKERSKVELRVHWFCHFLQ